MKVDTIRTVLARGQEAHPELAGRMERAAMLVVLRRVEPEPDGTWLVESERERGLFYTVRSDPDAPCTCPDVARAPQGRCKHVLAVALLRACWEEEQRQREAAARAARAYAAAWR